MAKHGGHIIGIVILVLKALVITSVTGLIGLYSPSEPYHYVKNGLPLPFIIQVIDVEAAKYVEIRIDPLFLLLDILIWAGLILLLSFSGRMVNRILSSRIK
ncbi:MAG: hypothetical protein QW304_04025 [Thermoproteota archaeon]